MLHHNQNWRFVFPWGGKTFGSIAKWVFMCSVHWQYSGEHNTITSPKCLSTVAITSSLYSACLVITKWFAVTLNVVATRGLGAKLKDSTHKLQSISPRKKEPVLLCCWCFQCYAEYWHWLRNQSTITIHFWLMLKWKEKDLKVTWFSGQYRVKHGFSW